VSQPNQLVGHVFISYVREDTERVDRLQQELEAARIPIWRDTASLRKGDDWRQCIRRAITEDALAFIACFSQASHYRDVSYQNEELYLAISQLSEPRRDVAWLFPVRFDDCAIPDADIGYSRTLLSLERADLFGDGYNRNVNRLIEAILRIPKSRSDDLAETRPPEDRSRWYQPR